jgi:manganese transport protein
VAASASVVLWTGSYRTIERVLVAMVLLMSVVFFVTAAAVSPGPLVIARNLAVPALPQGSLVTAMGLIGTTIVPYNLFLHANVARERWHGERGLRNARADLVVSILLGGIVSMSILVTGAAHPGSGVTSAADMALALEPVLGTWARSFLAVGLFAAGFTSAITAPLAAAFALSGIFGWVSDMRSPLFRGVWGAVMFVGAVFAALSTQPVRAIVLAQAANGILLPAVAIFLLVVMNDRRVLGTAANGWMANFLGGVVVLLTVVLGARLLLGALGIPLF